MIATDAVDAIKRLRACSRRRDYDVLEPLLRAPWLALINKAGVAGIDILTRTMARRGELAADADSCQAAGIDITALTSDGELDDYRGGYVVAAGLVDRVQPTVDMVQLSYELPGPVSNRYTRVTRYRYGRSGQIRRRYRSTRSSRVRVRDLQAWYKTERRLRFKPSRSCAVGKGDVRVLFGRIVRVELDETITGREIGWMSLINCYPVELEIHTK